ncbi:MAG: tRNA modification GTPase [Nannocystaceae bacterium]
MRATDTIVGIATGTPDGGVAIVRVSGVRAAAIARKLAGKLGAPRHLVRRRLRLPSGEEDALVVWMPAPNSFTGEDVCELHVHAGEQNVREVVGGVLKLGAVAAGPGAFSRRAFANGKMTLDQAEGVAALIAARTLEGLEGARRLCAGELGREVSALEAKLGRLRVEIEAHLDFPEDVFEPEVQRWRTEVGACSRNLQTWLRGFEVGKRRRGLPRVVLAGPPNAGKSALFNALLTYERALVSPVAGTTRDYVEAEVEIGPYRCVLVDTAGVRESCDSVEARGVARTRDQVSGADLVVWLEAADTADACGVGDVVPAGARVLRLESKRDMGSRRDWPGVSVVAGIGLSAIHKWIARWFESDGASPWIGLQRHHERAVEAGAEIEFALLELGGDAALEIVAFHLRAAQGQLSEIIGRDELGPVGVDILDAIFERFCIGK